MFHVQDVKSATTVGDENDIGTKEDRRRVLGWVKIMRRCLYNSGQFVNDPERGWDCLGGNLVLSISFKVASHQIDDNNMVVRVHVNGMTCFVGYREMVMAYSTLNILKSKGRFP